MFSKGENMDTNYSEKEKKGFGLLVGLFFSIIGLFAAFLYPSQSEERLTFIEGWKLSLYIHIGLAVIAVIIYLIVTTII